jgi:hypothetical protein
MLIIERQLFKIFGVNFSLPLAVNKPNTNDQQNNPKKNQWRNNTTSIKIHSNPLPIIIVSIPRSSRDVSG